MSENPFANAVTDDLTVLELRGDGSTMRRIAGDATQARVDFPLGLDLLVRQCFRHEPPLPLELEHAIDLTEEAVMPLASRFSGPLGLILQGEGALRIANALEVSGIAQTVLSLDEVESLFNRLVAVSQGRPATQETLPTDAGMFACLLILRELMHHLHFSSVALTTPPDLKRGS